MIVAQVPIPKLNLNERFEVSMPKGAEVLEVRQRPPRPTSVQLAGYDSGALWILYALVDETEKETERRAFITVAPGQRFNPTPGSRFLSTTMHWQDSKTLAVVHFFEIAPISARLESVQ